MIRRDERWVFLFSFEGIEKLFEKTRIIFVKLLMEVT